MPPLLTPREGLGSTNKGFVEGEAQEQTLTLLEEEVEVVEQVEAGAEASNSFSVFCVFESFFFFFFFLFSFLLPKKEEEKQKEEEREKRKKPKKRKGGKHIDNHESVKIAIVAKQKIFIQTDKTMSLSKIIHSKT